MQNTDPRIDVYIAKAEEFAKPILTHLRALVHAANPEIQETIKWGMPFYEYKGPCCSMASFKKHVAFGFWKAKLLNDPDGHLGERSAQRGDAMGNLGRIDSLADLPSDDILIEFIEQACKLNVDKIK